MGGLLLRPHCQAAVTCTHHLAVTGPSLGRHYLSVTARHFTVSLIHCVTHERTLSVRRTNTTSKYPCLATSELRGRGAQPMYISAPLAVPGLPPHPHPPGGSPPATPVLPPPLPTPGPVSRGLPGGAQAPQQGKGSWFGARGRHRPGGRSERRRVAWRGGARRAGAWLGGAGHAPPRPTHICPRTPCRRRPGPAASRAVPVGWFAGLPPALTLPGSGDSLAGSWEAGRGGLCLRADYNPASDRQGA